VQVDPIKSTLKAPGIQLLKLKCDKPLSNFAFKFNLSRYTTADLPQPHVEVGWCRLPLSNLRRKRLELSS